MDYTTAQIDARNALRCHLEPRGRRAALAGKEALCYRYESKQFLDLDLATFVDLYARLPPLRLAKVAQAPEVIEERSGDVGVFDAFWPGLYQEGRDEKPLWAALFLVGMLDLYPLKLIVLTREEAAEHALSNVLRLQENPPGAVIDRFSRHVSRLKKALCNPNTKKKQGSNRDSDAEWPVCAGLQSPAVDDHGSTQSRKRKTSSVEKKPGRNVPPPDHASIDFAGNEWIIHLRNPLSLYPAVSYAEQQRIPETRAQAASVSFGLSAIGSPDVAPSLDVHGLALSQSVEPIEPAATELARYDDTKIRPDQSLHRQGRISNIQQPRPNVDCLAMPQGSTRRAYVSADNPEMYTRSIVTPGGTTTIIDSVTRTDVPRTNRSTTVPELSWISGGSFAVPHP